MGLYAFESDGYVYILAFVRDRNEHRAD